ncbi:MAG: aldehyde dehydrogenase [Pusillimonas sp.]
MSETIKAFSNFINNRWTQGTGDVLESIEPYTGEVWATVPDASIKDVNDAVSAARAAFDTGPWGKSTPQDRARLLRRLGDLVAQHAEEFALLESRDNGKLYREMLGQWRYLPEWFYYYAGIALTEQGHVLPSDKTNFFVYTQRQAIGVVAAITAWNSPGLLMVWKLAPALAAGCTFVIKPSEHAPVSTVAFARLIEEAGFPPGVFNVITGGAAAGKALVEDLRVDKVAFTGSDTVGRIIAQSVSANFTRYSLELGGKSAQIVFPDAPVEDVVNGILAGIFAAGGQSCMAGSRLLVHRDVHDVVVQALVDRVKRIRLGDPQNPETDVGPIATEPQFKKILALIGRAREQSAVVATGGGAVSRGGWFVQPTVLTHVDPASDIAQEEVFGPVLSVIAFDDEEQALQLANATRYGLAAGVWTQDVRRAHRFAQRLRAGSIWINAYRTVGPYAPFGGFGHSGVGRENGIDGLNEFREVKSVWIETSGNVRDPFVIG